MPKLEVTFTVPQAKALLAAARAIIDNATSVDFEIIIGPGRVEEGIPVAVLARAADAIARELSDDASGDENG